MYLDFLSFSLEPACSICISSCIHWSSALDGQVSRFVGCICCCHGVEVDLGVSRALDFSLRFADEIESSCRRLQKKLRLGVSRTARRHGRNMRVDEKNHYSNSTVSMNHLCSVPPVGESPVTGLSSDGVEIFVMDQHELDDDAAVLFSFSRSLRELADSVDRSLGRLKATERLHGEPSDCVFTMMFSPSLSFFLFCFLFLSFLCLYFF